MTLIKQYFLLFCGLGSYMSHKSVLPLPLYTCFSASFEFTDLNIRALWCQNKTQGEHFCRFPPQNIILAKFRVHAVTLTFSLTPPPCEPPFKKWNRWEETLQKSTNTHKGRWHEEEEWGWCVSVCENQNTGLITNWQRYKKSVAKKKKSIQVFKCGIYPSTKRSRTCSLSW